jgi:NAD(P)-dependent dehydrogenase (short-subunit alcohol dehydrogenase family)
MRLAGQVAWITGTSSGIGRAIADRFAREGAAVLCCDVRPEADPRGFDSGPPTHERITAAGGRAAYVHCDVTDPAQSDAALQACLDEFGRCDIHVANAGIAPAARDLFATDDASYERVIEINQNAVWRTCRAAAARMVEQGGGGRIIVLSSIAGLTGIDSGADYVMSKHAVMGLVRVMSRQLGPHGINVNAINPGYLRTAMNRESLDDPERTALLISEGSLPRLGEPDDIAGAAAFLASDDASWVTGIALPVDGGYTAR